jgi:hypothetical protein
MGKGLGISLTGYNCGGSQYKFPANLMCLLLGNLLVHIEDLTVMD